MYLSNRKYSRHYVASFNRAKQDVSLAYTPLANEHLDGNKSKIRTLAFYLPQFHPVPVNDKAWGAGFTEWTNVSKAVPQFEGHYQPRLPGELGFYDLRLKEVQQRQIDLARQYGLNGFCYYHYWFNGTKALERPFQQVLNDKTLDFPFSLCWANESWTRRMNGSGDNSVIIPQAHSDEDDIAFIKDIEPALRDPRYIHVGGRPLLVIYRPYLLPDLAATKKRWNEYTRSVGLPDLYIAGVESKNRQDCLRIGCDATVQFPPHNIGYKENTTMPVPKKLLNKAFAGEIVDYEVAVEKSLDDINQGLYTFPGIIMGWDNEARKPGNGLVFHGCTPAKYKHWLESIFTHLERRENNDEKIVFINAWNEWAEGTYLEPDRYYGYSYLQATADVIKKFIARN